MPHISIFHSTVEPTSFTTSSIQTHSPSPHMLHHHEMRRLTCNSPKHPPLCKECKSNLSKYTRPGCFVRSCSLPCVKAHKQHTRCTGKRQRTQFFPLSQFDDNLLLSDYNLFEEVKRVAESAQRTRINLFGYSHFKIPSHLQGLRNAAESQDESPISPQWSVEEGEK
ncbi:unnamed protein product, partial [Vitis vinifera]|uniref:HIT-type domain-containing protein n=1 Tax=Vitis vinifera TaxID=29760 RepID=D7U7Z4_VITVI